MLDTRNFSVPDLDPILAYKGVWALCTRGDDGLLKATHFTVVLVLGRSPIWGIWTVDGKFIAFAGSRNQIERRYPHLTWRRRMATWQMADITDKSVEKRRAELKETYGKNLPRRMA